MTRSRIFLPALLLFLIATLLLSTQLSSAKTISKKHTDTHIIRVADDPVIVKVTVATTDTYTGTYSDKSGKRNFTKHSETVLFDSINDRYYTSQLHPFIGHLQFEKPSKKCNIVSCKCSFYIGKTTFAIKHNCSTTKITCKKGGGTYCKGGYTITGGILVTGATVKFKNLAK